ncbi:MAG: [protein-PII] uridylyltransferase [Gammaproteobacteria bacterium]|nr:[protein-PII] uridylyltransferase [Gammaproteobacteria bacterium]MDX2462665.1 [protein-PII] uridylyltransferase [Gammaproteobacteria bacterium]
MTNPSELSGAATPANPNAAPQPAWGNLHGLTSYRDALASARQSLAEQYRGGVAASALVRQSAEFIDTLLAKAWRAHDLPADKNLALVAVGGYGRGELHPGSDVDLLILVDKKRGHSGQIQAFITFLWDIGLEVGQSVRSVKDCVRESKKDITVTTNLMEARLIVGDLALFERMRQATSAEKFWPSRKFFEAKWAEQRARHHKFHDTAYNLEPNVKEGPGGLRDIQMIGWVAKRHFGADTLHDLVTHEFLTESEYESLTQGQGFLWQVRFALHTLAGRREDRLVFDYQRALAEQFGYSDDDANLAVEKFMKRYYRTIMELSRLNEMLLELFQEAILHAHVRQVVTPINRRFRSVNGFIEVTDDNVFKRNPFALLEVFLIVQQHDELKGVRASTIRLIRDHRHLIDEKFRADLRARSLFMEILKQPNRITRELRRMHRYGVLEEYLPAFGAVVGQMQYDLFHTYTVDEHSLFVVQNIRAFASPQRPEAMPRCPEIFARLPKPHLLYIAGLFHDIAKGRGGDHSELGMRFAMDFCTDHGLGQYDARLVAWLVRHHLTMSLTAQRRDITDPDIIKDFAQTVGDQNHLDYLLLLTVADVRGTNPALWNDWKATLLGDLYESTGRALRRGLENPIDRAELIAETQHEARRLLDDANGISDAAAGLWASLGDDYFLRSTADEIAWHTRAIVETDSDALPLALVRQGRGGTEVFVYAADQEFLFAASTSVLGRLGLNIVDSRIITADNGMTLDSYVVFELDGTSVSGLARQREISAALRAALAQPRDARRHDRRLAKRQLRHFQTPTQVSFSDDSGNARTVMEVIAADRPGLLSVIGWALADCRVRLQNAKIATFGERAEDVFFLTDASNRPLAPESFDAVAERVTAAIDAANGGQPPVTGGKNAISSPSSTG